MYQALHEMDLHDRRCGTISTRRWLIEGDESNRRGHLNAALEVGLL
jgi:hypothetical protein